MQKDLLWVIKLQYRPVNHNPDVKWHQKTVILYLKKRVLQLNFELQILLAISFCNVRRRYKILQSAITVIIIEKKPNFFLYLQTSSKTYFCLKKSIPPSSLKKKLVNNINRIIHQSKSLTLCKNKQTKIRNLYIYVKTEYK